MSKKAAVSERRMRALQVQAEHRRRERRRTFLVIGGAVAVAVLIVGSAVFALVQEQRRQNAVDTAAKGSIAGVKTYKGLASNHVTTAVVYPQKPSVGGNHAPVWANCGVYDQPVDPMQATHALEHGAVWVGYDPKLSKSDVATLAALGQVNNYVLVSPVEGLKAPVTLSAWGTQLAVQKVDDPRVQTFVKKYQSGPQTPEPGASCTGGVGNPR